MESKHADRRRPCGPARLWPALGLLAGLVTACAEPATTTIDLVELMPLASVLHEIETVDVGGADDRRWLRDGWSIVGSRGMDTTFRWITSESATLELWLARPRDVEMVWTGWPLNFPDAPVQAIRFEANGRTLGSFELDHGWQPREYRVTWPASAQRRGPNLIRLVPSTRHVPADVIEDAEDPRALASAWSSLRLEWSRFADEPWVRERTTRPTLALPVGSRIEFFIQPTGPATLEIDRLAVAGEVSAGAPDLRVSVLADRGEEQSVDLSAGSAEPLSMLLQETDQPLRIAFEAIADDETAAVLQLVAPRLVIEPSESERSTESQGDGTVTSPPVESASTEPWNVLIYVVDSLRADHLGCYGYDRPTSPELDRFAADAVRFEQVVAQASWTRATVASMLTGLYPHAHGAVGREDVLAETTPYLAEILKAAGYATAGFVTNENVAALFGFGRGYDIYHHFPEDDELVEHHVLSDALNDVLFQWLEERDPERPFFLYAHASDPHYPYRPRSPFLERFAGSVADPSIGDLDPVVRLVRRLTTLGEPGRRDLIDLYDGEIAFNDHHFGRLLDHLERTGLDDTTIVVFAGDHGEEFLDHDGWGHGATLYEEQLHVPLVVRLPDRRGAGRVVRGPVQQVDLLPTLLDALGHVVPTEIQGESRFAAMTTASERAAESTTPQSFAELHLDGEDADALFDGRFKLIADGSGEHIELFDLSVDPAEQHDLARERPVLAGFLRAQLLARREASAARTVGRQAADLDPEARSRLEALGYLN